MKLLDMLLEVLRESKPITLDKSVVPQMEKVYEKFKELYKQEKVIKYLYSTDGILPLGSIDFKNFYDPSFKGVDVYLNFDNNTNVKARYNILSTIVKINVNSNVGIDKSTFMNTLYHELVHAIDPKLNNKNVRSSLSKNLKTKDAKDKSSTDYTKYIKKPWEFDAWSSSLVNQIKDELEILQDPFKQKAKDALKDLINALLRILKSNPNANLDINQEFFDDFKGKYWEQLAIIRTLLFDNSFTMIHEFLTNILEYLNKPSQFKKYIQRLSTLL